MVSGILLAVLFSALPVGFAWVSTPLIELLRTLAFESFVLTLQISAPVVFGLMLAGLAMGIGILVHAGLIVADRLGTTADTPEGRGAAARRIASCSGFGQASNCARQMKIGREI